MMKSDLLNHLLLSAIVSIALSLPAASAGWKKPLIPVTADFTLPNGLRVILSEDHSSPVVSTVIIYDVGARNEVKGHSGFAHLFEHMMFEGSENVGKTEHFKYIESAGGSVNASTHADFTNYYDKLPSNKAELALWLESDRMRSLKVTPETLENQLQTVKEEKRSSIDNQPYAPASITFDELLFDNWANAHPVIGSFADLEASSIQDVRQFFRTYYAPDNAVLAMVGDFDPQVLRKQICQYFATIPSQPAPPKPDVSEPTQTKSKYAKVEDQHAQLPAFWMGWKAPPRRSPDYYSLSIIEKLLSSGESSRLYQRLIKGDEVALKAEAGLDERRGPGAFDAFVIVKPGHSAEDVRQILWSEISKLKDQPVTGVELEKARNQVLRGLFAAGSYESLQRSLGRAELLAQYALFYGDPKLIDQDLETLMKVTPADIQAAAKRYFTTDGVTVVDISPAHTKADLPEPKAATASSTGGTRR